MVNVGKEATLTGWGRQWHNGPLAQQLEMATLPLISNQVSHECCYLCMDQDLV